MDTELCPKALARLCSAKLLDIGAIASPIAIIAITKISAFFKVVPVIFSIEAPDIRKIRS